MDGTHVRPNHKGKTMRTLTAALTAALIAALIALLCCAPAYAQQLDTRETDRAQASIIGAGHPCKTCEGGYRFGENQSGSVAKVFCNGKALQYRVVTSRTTGMTCVEPWDARPSKCGD